MVAFAPVLSLNTPGAGFWPRQLIGPEPNTMGLAQSIGLEQLVVRFVPETEALLSFQNNSDMLTVLALVCLPRGVLRPSSYCKWLESSATQMAFQMPQYRLLLHYS